MRIAIVMELASPWARDVALGLSSLGHAVHVVDFVSAGPKSGYLSMYDDFQAEDVLSLRNGIAGTHLIRTSISSGLRYFLSAPQLRRIVKECEAELLLTLYGGGFAAMAYASGFRPYAVYVVGSDVLMAEGLQRKMRRVTLHNASSVFVNGVYLSHKTQELAPEARIYKLYLGVDTSRFHPAPRKPQPVKIICTRGFLQVYNNELLVRALMHIPDSAPTPIVTFTSSGPQLDEVRKLAKAILPPRILKSVAFLGGVSDAELTRRLRDSHIYVSVSRSDGTSISLLEALAAGVYPVLSDIPQNREWIDLEANNGMLVSPDDPKELADALIKAIEDDQFRTRSVAYNRDLVMQRASREQSIRSLESELERINSTGR